MEQNVEKLRGFFSAFFALPQPVWGGFLAGWPGLPGNENHDSWLKRFSFATGLFVKMPLQVQLSIMLYAIRFTLEYGPYTLLRSVTPPFLFGTGPGTPAWEPPRMSLGDEEAKEEARQMMKKFKPTVDESVPLYYNAEKGLLPPPFD